MLEYGLRFLAGGIAVSAFAALGDTLRPKSFAGLFGAAPSIALATLLITLSQKGAPFVAMEGRSMIVGAFALPAYSWTVCVLLKKFLLSSRTATMAALIVWFAVALGVSAALFQLPRFFSSSLPPFARRAGTSISSGLCSAGRCR
jgi:hypothetical protein